jgi:hypothetical protein
MPVHRIHRVGSPYNASELANLDFEQTADVLYLAHENHAPTKLIRAGHAKWSFETIAFGPTIAVPQGVAGVATNPNQDQGNAGNAYFPQVDVYVVTAFNEETGQESRASAPVTLTNDISLKRNYNTITWNAVPGATLYRVYKGENTQLYGFIGATDELSFRDDNAGPDLSDGPPTGDNPFGGAGDYPATVTFHEQRAFWGRSINRPNAVWASRSADYENMDFTRPSRADDAFAIGLVANKVNSVNQLVSTNQGLLALTSHNIFSIQGSNEDYISASPPPRVRPEIARGVSRLNPLTVDNVVFYETAKSGEVRTIGYEFQQDGIRTDDLTVFSRHLFENQDIIGWAYAEKPASCIWLVRGDGKLLCLTWDQAQEVWGWTLCETDGRFESVCVITEQGEDRAYFVVRRTIGGVNKLFVERMASELWQDQVDACYLDCARTFTNAVPSATIDRLEHLEGRVVTAYADGFVVPGLTVTNGTVELPHPAARVTVGLPYTALIETLPLAIQTREGWSVARPQQAKKTILRLVRSREVEVGHSDDSLRPLKLRDRDDAYGQPTALFTGDKEVPLDRKSGTETTIVVRSVLPLPMHIAAVMIEPQINGDG